MRFSEVAHRLTGFSCPIFGASWDPGEAKVAAARRVLVYLEDRRVLFAPWNVEVPEHCVDSIMMIRQFLTDQLGLLDDTDDDLAPHLRAMRAACREFLSITDSLRQQSGGLRPWAAGTPGWKFNDALGELRALFGVHIAQMSAKFGIDVEDELSTILPPAVGDDQGEDDHDDVPHRRGRGSDGW